MNLYNTYIIYKSMSGAKIYLARHGQTFFNLEDRLGGDSELTPKGFEHAEKVSRCLEGVYLDAIYSSTLRRSIQTAEVLHRFHHKISLIQKPELSEISSGDMDSMTYAEFERQFPDLFKARQNDKYHWSFPNGESYELALNRVIPFLDTLKSEGRNTAIVGHQGMNRTILGYLLDLPRTEVPYLVTPNDVIFVIEPDDKRIVNIKDGKIFEGYIVDKHTKKADV